MRRDKITLNRLVFYGYHGLFEEENRLGQRFIINIELFTCLKQAGASDDMNDSIDYGQAYELIADIVQGEPKNLIEAVAEEIANQLFASFQLLEACRVEVVKPDPPIKGVYESVSVDIYRERKR